MENYENFINIIKEGIHTTTGIPISDMIYAKQGEESAMKGDRLLIHVHKNEQMTQTYGVHIKDSFEFYQNGMPTEQIIHQISKQIAHFNELDISDLPTIIYDYEKIKPKLFVRLVNADSYKLKQRDVIYKQIGDIAIVLYYSISNPQESEIISTIVRKTFFDSWNKAEDEVFETAFANTYASMPPRLYEWNPNSPLDFTGKDFMNHNESINEECIVNCISTATKTNGAVAVFLPGVAKRIAELLNGDFYVAFTSIHEAMIHATTAVSAEELQQILQETIDECVDNDEFLSYNILRYSKDEQKFTFIEKQ